MTKPKIKEKLPEKLPPIVEHKPTGTAKAGVFPGEDGAPKKTTLLKYDPNTNLTDEQKEALQQEMDEAQDEASAKPAQPDKHPSHIGKKEEQPFLFGEADQILNALETELTEWKMIYEKLDSGMERLVKKMEAAEERMSSLKLAIDATRKHAPMKEDPAPPVVDDLVKDMKDTPKEKIMEHFEKQEKIIAEDESETTTPGTAPAPEAPTSSGKKEAKKTKVALGVAWRNPTQPVPEVLFPGDIVGTSWKTGPLRIEEISGPYGKADVAGVEIESPNHYSLKCSEVDAKRNKDGRLPKDYEYSCLNLVVAVGNKFLSVFEESSDEILLLAEDIGKQKPNPDPVQAELPEKQEEDLY